MTIRQILARIFGFPTCDSCGTVEWSSAERAYILGWRRGSDLGAAHGEGASVVLCPGCAE